MPEALCGVRGTQYRSNFEVPPLAGSGMTPFDSRFLTGNIDTSYSTGNDFSHLKSWGASATADYELNKNMTLHSISAYRGLNWVSGVDADGSPLSIAELSFNMGQQQLSQEF